MTADEKHLMLLLARTVESLFSETCALQTVLMAHRIPKPTWKAEANRLVQDPRNIADLRLKFQPIYEYIERMPEDSKAIEELLKGLPQSKKQWN